MASPQAEDVRMRADLAVSAVEEIAVRVEEVVKESGERGTDQDAAITDIYRLLGRLAEATGNLAMGLRLAEEMEAATKHREPSMESTRPLPRRPIKVADNPPDSMIVERAVYRKYRFRSWLFEGDVT
jgi:hypothetical protein